MTLSEILERIGTPRAISPEETEQRRQMIQSALQERQCPSGCGHVNTRAVRSRGVIFAFYCSACGARWGSA